VAWSKRNVFRIIRTQGNCGPRKELAAAGRRMVHSTKMARRRGHDRKRKDQDNVVHETQNGRTFGKRRWKGPECNNGILKQQLRGSKRIKYLGGRVPLYLRKERATTNGIGGWSLAQRSHLGRGGTLTKTLYEIFRGKIAKQAVENSCGLWRMVGWTLWKKERERKKREKTSDYGENLD
jgi:hypothetical protein